MHTRISTLSLVSLIGLTAVGPSGAQIAPGDKLVKLPAAPAPVLAAADQQTLSIWPVIRFDLPPSTVAIRVSRQQAGVTTLITPTDVPIASVGKIVMADHTYFGWRDAGLTALGTYAYSVAAVLDDGRVGVSGWIPYTPQVYEPQNVTVQKTSPYSVVVAMSNSVPLPAKTYRLYGTGIATFGLEATTVDKYRRTWTVTIGNLAAGTYRWTVRSEFDPGVRSSGIPVSVTLP